MHQISTNNGDSCMRKLKVHLIKNKQNSIQRGIILLFKQVGSSLFYFVL